MNLALKEWAAVVRALEDGTQLLIFRKGGIHDARGEFHMEKNEFLLYPTFEHQDAKLVKPEFHDLIHSTTAAKVGDVVRITSWAQVHRVFMVQDRFQIESLSKSHIWNDDYVNMRFQYKPEKALFVVMLRVFKLDTPIEFTEKTEYVGCKSWVPLDETADTEASSPVLSDREFQGRAMLVERAVEDLTQP